MTRKQSNAAAIYLPFFDRSMTRTWVAQWFDNATNDVRSETVRAKDWRDVVKSMCSKHNLAGIHCVSVSVKEG